VCHLKERRLRRAMPDGSPLTIGQVNNSSTPTQLVKDATESGGTALYVENIADRGANIPSGIHSNCLKGWGVLGVSETGLGVYGSSTNGFGVYGSSTKYAGVYGSNPSGPGVTGFSENGGGVYAESKTGIGVWARTFSTQLPALIVDNLSGLSSSYAADFGPGNVKVRNNLDVGGDKRFRIDHPLDPANKYLDHVSVEAPQRKNIYDGVVELDEEGAAWVTLPEYFEALNRDFCYQLTPIGAPAPALHIAAEVSENRFKIAGGQPGIKVSWQITGIRKDRWAEANPLEIEQEKGDQERGRYMHPELYSEPEDRGIHFRPHLLEDRVEEQQRQAEEVMQRMEEAVPPHPEAP
jgi:hypothetical protein